MRRQWGSKARGLFVPLERFGGVSLVAVTQEILVPTKFIDDFGCNTAFVLGIILSGAAEPANNDITQLKKKGIFTPRFETSTQIASYIQGKRLDGLGLGNYMCVWCGIKTTSLHKHHYPIRKSQGGSSVVEICPNCHQEFHTLESDFVVNPVLVDHFKEVLEGKEWE